METVLSAATAGTAVAIDIAASAEISGFIAGSDP
jgi:hypothetical protein